MNRELLEKPFAPEQINQRDGNFGKTLDDVKGHAIIQRLNDALYSKWSFEILEREIFNDLDEVIVQGKLPSKMLSTKFEVRPQLIQPADPVLWTAVFV